ncbi:hypothetical protein QQF64_034056 [Cirrhinus molitorella]|uniref:DDE-1 domain-containing protein n=1 Tax=Cirrhinus molitorella TaxID=172907 RepID=A0ABR3MVM9_9TELE
MFCRENKTEILCLPAHTTHILQPLDIAVFNPLKTAFSTMASRMGLVRGDMVVGKKLFSAVLKYVYPTAVVRVLPSADGSATPTATQLTFQPPIITSLSHTIIALSPTPSSPLSHTPSSPSLSPHTRSLTTPSSRSHHTYHSIITLPPSIITALSPHPTTPTPSLTLHHQPSSAHP